MAIDIQALQALLNETQKLNKSVSQKINTLVSFAIIVGINGTHIDRTVLLACYIQIIRWYAEMKFSEEINKFLLDVLRNSINSLSDTPVDQDSVDNLAQQIRIIRGPLDDLSFKTNAVIGAATLTCLCAAYASRDSIVRTVIRALPAPK
jgi:hypothetical protein